MHIVKKSATVKMKNSIRTPVIASRAKYREQLPYLSLRAYYE